MALPSTPSGGGSQTMQSRIKPEPEAASQTRTEPLPEAACGGETGDGENFHGMLAGALSEHRGMPMVCDWHARAPSSFNDGCGLCSPGRWALSRRNFQQGETGKFILRLGNLVKEFTHKVIPDTQRAFFALALDRKSTRLNSSHVKRSRMPSSA